MPDLHRTLRQSSSKADNPFNQNDWWVRLTLEIGTLFLLFSAMFALRNNMGYNEADVLPLARQYVQPGWIPNDWYLNQPPGYRLLFQTLFGHLAATAGFLTTSVVGRLVCYLLLSTGMVFIARKLSLKLPFLLLAIALNLSLHLYRGSTAYAGTYVPGIVDQWIGKQSADYLFYGLIILALALLATGNKIGVGPSFALLLLACGLFLAADNPSQSIAANEWYVGGLEAKAVAYALVFSAIALLLHGKYLLMALLFGLATSFHVLAGGYPMLTASAYLLVRRRSQFTSWHYPIAIVLVYLVGAAFAIPSVINQLIKPNPPSELAPSFIYVFVRLPHHLNPAAWPSQWWINLISYLSILAISICLIKKETLSSSDSSQLNSSASACFTLFEFTLIALIPFGFGLLISPFDQQGAYLQYYPFRFGDMLLPFTTCLLFSCALQYTCSQRSLLDRPLKRPLMFSLTALIVLFFSVRLVALKGEIKAILSFPESDPDKAELYQWASSYTDPAAKFMTLPSGTTDFTWITERPTIVDWKFLPQTKAGIVEWYSRISDETGDPQLLSDINLENIPMASQVANQLINKYKSLTTAQVKLLLKKYQVSYFITTSKKMLQLPVVFSNSLYVVYRNTDEEGVDRLR